MAKLIYLGPNSENVGGLSAKAYTVRRVGREVVARFGPVESVGGGGGNLRWLSAPQEKRWKFRTEALASEEVQKRIAEKVNGGYERLLGRVRIR